MYAAEIYADCIAFNKRVNDLEWEREVEGDRVNKKKWQTDMIMK